MSHSNYFVYITTNPSKTVLYTGVTNDLYTRMLQHYQNKGNQQTFAGRYHCYKLIYYERFDKPMDAIDREKEIKKWRRSKKVALINTMNPHWKFLNEEIKGY